MADLRGKWTWYLLGLALGLQLVTLGSKSLWLDEAASLQLAGGASLSEIWSGQVDARHPPLYYALLHQTAGWGSAAWQLRLPSVLVSWLSVGILYLLGRRLFPARPEVWRLAVLLLALAPLPSWYAQEARMYAFVGAAGLLLALGLSWRHAAGIFLVFAGALLGLLFDYTFIPLAVGLLALWLVDWWRRGPSLHWLVLPALALAAAWWVFQPWWPHLFQLLHSLNDVALFANLRRWLGMPALSATGFLLALPFSGLVLAGAAALGLRWFRRQGGPGEAGIWLSGLLLLLTLATAVPRFYTLKRVVVSGWPYVTLLLAWLLLSGKEGQGRAWGKRMPALALGLCSLAFLLTLFTPKDDWRGVVAFLNAQVPASGVVWLDPPWNRLPYDYYRPAHPGERGPWGDTARLAQIAGTTGDIWLVAERFGATPPTSAGEAWLDQQWQLVQSIPFARLEVRHYRPR